MLSRVGYFPRSDSLPFCHTLGDYKDLFAVTVFLSVSVPPPDPFLLLPATTPSEDPVRENCRLFSRSGFKLILKTYFQSSPIIVKCWTFSNEKIRVLLDIACFIPPEHKYCLCCKCGFFSRTLPTGTCVQSGDLWCTKVEAGYRYVRSTYNFSKFWAKPKKPCRLHPNFISLTTVISNCKQINII